MNVPFVDLYAQYLTIKADIDGVIADVIRQSAFIRSTHVTDFEAQWANTVGARHCVSCANGTDAIYIVMRGLGVKPGDEVITTAHSWISTSETITQAGGRVVFCDTDRETFTIDPKQIESKITPRTVGIIPVHLYGQPANMDPILEIAARRGLWVIEDCAQAHLAEYKGRQVGTMGTAATFSFYPGKNLGAMGDAGCLVTNDSRLASWSELYARHGGKGEHTIEGINSRLDGLHAAILSAKLPYLRGWTDGRQRIAARYDELLARVPGVERPASAAGRTHVFHLYVIRVRNRNSLQKHLSSRGVSTMLNYPRALPFYPAYAYLGHSPADFPVAHDHQDRILSLPIYPEMTDEMIRYVVDCVREGIAACE